jgi:hypothetical protein
MGTLFNQQPRMEYLTTDNVISIGQDIIEITESLDISFTEALNLYLAVAKVKDYDAKDEQLAGFGKLLQILIGTLEEKL